MIKVVGQSKGNVEYSVVYNQAVSVFNIESNLMNDNCRPYRESTGCMTFLVEDDMLGEIECIFPIVTETIGNWFSNDTKVYNATPKLKVSFDEKPVEIAFSNSQLILILNKDIKADKKYISSNCAFYVSDDELVAIACSDYKLL